VSGARLVAPPGYTRFALRDATVVARDDAVEGVKEALKDVRTLHCWAATVPGARAYHGRATVWGTRLPIAGHEIVVRHAQHGGMLAVFTGDRFVAPGRAPWELEVSLRLRAAGVRTPEVIAYVVYPAGPGLCRIDVATRRLPDGGDFPALWATADEPTRERMLAATAALVQALGAAGAHHEDLNVKNVYLSRGGGDWLAYALDVDRVRFLPPGDDRARQLTLARLVRSMEKSRTQFNLKIADADIAMLTRLVGSAA
jgi:3-deoxy-D-manno-octulosonic acid kinase